MVILTHSEIIPKSTGASDFILDSRFRSPTYYPTRFNSPISPHPSFPLFHQGVEVVLELEMSWLFSSMAFNRWYVCFAHTYPTYLLLPAYLLRLTGPEQSNIHLLFHSSVKIRMLAFYFIYVCLNHLVYIYITAS